MPTDLLTLGPAFSLSVKKWNIRCNKLFHVAFKLYLFFIHAFRGYKLSENFHNNLMPENLSANQTFSEYFC